MIICELKKAIISKDPNQINNISDTIRIHLSRKIKGDYELYSEYGVDKYNKIFFVLNLKHETGPTALSSENLKVFNSFFGYDFDMIFSKDSKKDNEISILYFL
ncbi:hypothetical protein [Methanobrevibacter sp. DSM 116169]|uniref:hypothetical protein n=1 Tax=Methanobrevibacter sp. DSM 116169 TaxID=3242727 RepID=UPI0038FC0283